MKFTLTGVVLFAMMISAPASAGVVLQRRQTITSGGQQRSVEETVMIEGARERRTTKDIDIITDLDARKVTTVDNTAKSFVETQYPPPMMPAPALAMQLGLIADFTLQDGQRMVAGYKCTYYRAMRSNRAAQMKITQCVSVDAPGAAVYHAFDQKRIDILKSERANVPRHLPPGMPLEMTMSASPVMPNTGETDPNELRRWQEMLAKQPTSNTTTEVLKVSVRDLPADTFKVPKGYARVQPKQIIGMPSSRMPAPGTSLRGGAAPLRRDPN
ncbi:MAG: hypothetical protein ACREQB_10955 [Candidatus Binataceae bacterium]